MALGIPPIVTKKQLLDALNRHKSIAIAAGFLGIAESTVFNLTKKYGIRKTVSWR